MPLLSAGDPLPWEPKRILVLGTSGSGKSTLARRVGEKLDLPRVELDSLHHGENWVPRPTFAAEVAAFAEQPRWITEWQYTEKLGTTLIGKADTVLWLDLPRSLIMRQVIVRTVRRRVRREVLWNGNTEGPLWTVFRDPDHIIRWAWKTHHKAADRVRDLLEWRDGEVAVVRFTGRRHLGQWLDRLS